MSSRIIQLVTPKNQAFKIDLRGKENELIDLISMISGITKSDIKGLKDCYGNYYTISSAINNPHLNSDFSDVYFLLCAFDSEFTSNRQTQVTSNGKNHGMNSISSPDHFKNLNCIRNPNRVQNFLFNSNNPNQFTRKNPQESDRKYTNRNTVACENSQEYVSDTYKINQKSETDYVNFYNRYNSDNENSAEKIFWSPNYFPKKSSENDAINSIVKEIQKDKFFNVAQISKMNQLIKEENEDIMCLFKVYSQNTIEKKSLVSGLNKIINKNICDKSSAEFAVQRKEKLNYFVDQLVQEFSEENDDIILLKTLIEYENEFVMKAFDVYEEERDEEKFKVSLQKILLNRKKIVGRRNSNTNNKSENDTAHFLDKKAEEKIISSLHTEERIIFKYAIKNNFKEIELLSELFETFKKEEILIKPTKLLCKKFIEENVIQNLDDFQKSLFNELLSSRNQNLLEIFKKFKEHDKLEKLEREIVNLISKHDSRSSIEISKNSKDFSPKKRMSSSEDSENENSLLNKNKTENQKNSTNEFINLVNVMNFLKPEEKKEFEASINKNSLSAIQLVNDYHKTKNIMSIKSSLLSMFRKSKNPLDSSLYSGEKIDNEKQKQKEDTSSIIRHSNRKFKTAETTSKVDSFVQILENLEKYEKISSDQRQKLFKRFENKDEKVLSVWEVYKHNNNLADLAESLFILTKNTKREKSQFQLSHTTNILSKSKKDIQDFFKNKNIIDEKEELKIKQMNIIKILEKENFIDKEQLGIIHHLIEDENHLLISAFEVLSVTKDHDEFCDTLIVICKNYKNNELKNENSKTIPKSTTDNKEMRLNQIFKDFIIHTENFNENEKNLLSKLFSNKNEFILSALELFDKESDEIDFVDSLKIALKIQKN